MKKVSLACTNCQTKNYYEHKSNSPRLVKSKFCKRCGSHYIHKEEK